MLPRGMVDIGHWLGNPFKMAAPYMRIFGINTSWPDLDLRFLGIFKQHHHTGYIPYLILDKVHWYDALRAPTVHIKRIWLNKTFHRVIREGGISKANGSVWSGCGVRHESLHSCVTCNTGTTMYWSLLVHHDMVNHHIDWSSNSYTYAINVFVATWPSPLSKHDVFNWQACVDWMIWWPRIDQCCAKLQLTLSKLCLPSAEIHIWCCLGPKPRHIGRLNLLRLRARLGVRVAGFIGTKWKWNLLFGPARALQA